MRVAVLIDGGHLRVLSKKAGHDYSPRLIEKIALSIPDPGEFLFRVLYYDCAPYAGVVKLPVSGQDFEYKASDRWLKDVAALNLFAVRRGVLKFRGFQPKRKVLTKNSILSDDDFQPVFEQKGVDMRIGLDMASFSTMKSVDRLILVSGDTDCVPAMKYARINGLQIVLAVFPGQRISPEMLWHSDIVRSIEWPVA